MGIRHLLYILAVLAFTSVNANNNFSLKTVVIDAGHGGKDPGAIGPGKTNEKDIALVVALKLGDYIQKHYPDVNVIYTRKTDVFLELHERAEIANKAKADLFIAIHINSSPNPETYGSSCYVLGLHRTEANLEVAKRENAVINLEDDKDKYYEFDPNSPEGHIIMSMKQNAFLDQSIDLASKAENQMENYAKRKSLGVKQAGFYVLYKTTMPSMLAEIGFISNTEEEKFLNSIKGQDLIATALFNSFKDYKSEMEGSEGDSFIMDQMKQQQDSIAKAAAKNDKSTTASTQKTETKPEPKTEPKVEPKTEPKTDNKPANGSTTAKTDGATTTTANKGQSDDANSFVTTTNGQKIRKPIENSNGGGKADKQLVSENDVQPIYVRPSNLNPFDTTSMSSMMGGKDNKPESKSTPKGSNTANHNVAENKSEPKGEPKTEPKSEVKNETKSESNKSPLVPEHKSENGIVFKIQLFALKGDLKEYDKVSKLFNTLSAETLPNGFTRYYGGHLSNYAEAEKMLKVAKDAGYNAAFIVGFNNGNRMGNDELNAQHK
ncbi:MAG: N-acetylmuramoyl-L-alanine amidase [Chitinophagales bacterium]